MTDRIIRAFGDAFAGSIRAAMGIPPTVPMQCYWYAGCSGIASTVHRYKELGEVPVCASCKEASMSKLDRLRALWEQKRCDWNI